MKKMLVALMGIVLAFTITGCSLPEPTITVDGEAYTANEINTLYVKNNVHDASLGVYAVVVSHIMNDLGSN